MDRRKLAFLLPGLLVACSLMVCSLPACSHHRENAYRPVFVSASPGKKELLFGVPAVGYYECAELIARDFNEHLDGIKVRPVACMTLGDYENKLRSGYFDFTVINGPQLVMAEENGYAVVGKIADEYRSVIVVNKDSAVRTFADLRGRTICLVGPHILAGDVMPLMYLYRNGVDVNKDLRRIYAPSFESDLLDVCLGKCSAGAVWGTAYTNFCKTRPDLAARLELRWESPSLVSAGVLIRRDMNSALSEKLTGLLIHLQNEPLGRRALAMLGIHKLEAADSTSYLPLKKILREYDKYIH